MALNMGMLAPYDQSMELFKGSLGFSKAPSWLALGIAVLKLGQALPDENYKEIKAQGTRVKDIFPKVLLYAIINYRTWIFALSYGYYFRVELTMDNIIAQYFYDRFNLHSDGTIVSIFGMANLVTRPSDDMLLDHAARCFGMRGLLWALWSVQTLGGVFCVLLGCLGSLAGAISTMIIFSCFAEVVILFVALAPGFLGILCMVFTRVCCCWLDKKHVNVVEEEEGTSYLCSDVL